jgi:hypothetical protein
VSLCVFSCAASAQRDQHEAVELLKIALQYTDDYADVYKFSGMEYLYDLDCQVLQKKINLRYIMCCFEFWIKI